VVFLLDNELWFPDPRLADDDGCLAIGGDLSVDRLLLAYQHGIFPWFSFRDTDKPVWYCPHERFVIFPDDIHVSHSMRTLLNKRLYTFSFNRDFEGVISNCSQLRIDEEGAWLGDDIIEAYTMEEIATDINEANKEAARKRQAEAEARAAKENEE
jgi:leucyl/phenylalanyl-tRNA--protein transferase